MTDASTLAAIAALAVAFVALLVTSAQALQQYLVSGQLIRICDSVVYGKLPGQGHRVWQFSQFRFRVVYSIPQISLSPNLWIGISSKARTVDVESPTLPSLKVSDSKSNRTLTAGEASWVSFTRTIQHACGRSLRYKMVEGDADRCPSDLPVVPMQLSMRDVVVVALMAGMDCTDVSFQSGSLSMQGDAGTITSSRHPVLGALIHFAPKDLFENHGISGNNGTVNADWVARMVDIVTVAGCRLDSHDRMRFEEDESSWVKSTNYEGPMRSQRPPSLPISSTLRQRRRTGSSRDVEDQISCSTQKDELSGINVSRFNASAALRRPQDGEWSFGLVESIKASKPKIKSNIPSIARATQRHGRIRTALHNGLRRAMQAASSDKSASILPVSVSKEQDQQPSKLRAVSESWSESIGGEIGADHKSADAKAGPPLPTHRRQASVTEHVAASRQSKLGMNTNSQQTKQLLLLESDALGQSPESPEQVSAVYSDDQSNNLDSPRNEYVTNRWQEILQQRRKDRSRGRSQSARVMPAKLEGVARRSALTTRPGQNLGRHQLRLRQDHRSNRAAESDSDSNEMQNYDSPKTGTSPRRGRRRNSSLVRERTGAEVVAYGNQPIPSNAPSSNTAERSWSSASADPNRTTSQQRNQRTSLSPHKGPNSLGDHSYSVVDPSIRPSKSDSSAVEKPRKRVRIVSPSPSVEVDSRVNSPSSPSHEIPETRGILRRPTEHFPEYPRSPREGVAPLASVARDIPRDAKWTKIARQLIDPEALILGNERFEERQEHVIVLRVLTKDEIEHYALVTARLREQKRHVEEDREKTSKSSGQAQSSADEDASSSDSETSGASFERAEPRYLDQSDDTDEPHRSPRSIRNQVVDHDTEPEVADHRLPEQGYEDEDDQGAQQAPLIDKNLASAMYNKASTNKVEVQVDSQSGTSHGDAHMSGVSIEPKSKIKISDGVEMTSSTSPPLDLDKYPLSYEEELIILQCGSVLKRARKCSEQCKDIAVTLKFCIKSQPSVENEVKEICASVETSNWILKRCLTIVEPIQNQRKLALFVNAEVDVLVCGLRVSYNVLERNFGLFEITPMDFDVRWETWRAFNSAFEKHFSCSMLEHLTLGCHFGYEILANLEAGILSSPESNLLKSRFSMLSKLTKASTTAVQGEPPLRSTSPFPSLGNRFFGSPIRLMESPPQALNSEPLTGRYPRRTKELEQRKTTSRQLPKSMSYSQMRRPSSSETDDSSFSSEDVSTDPTLADSMTSFTGVCSWLWVCQADILPGFLATPWKALFPEAVCLGAISVLLNVLKKLASSSNLRYVTSQDYCQAWIDAGRSTYPSYAQNADGGVVASGVYELVDSRSFASQIPVIELLHSYGHQVNRTYFHSTHSVRENLGELVGLDSWLSICGRMPEISEGPSNLLRTLPSFIQSSLTDFELEFSSLDRTSYGGGQHIIQIITGGLIQCFTEHHLSLAEQVFITVAMLRTVKLALCVARGSDTSGLRDVLIHDVQVYMA